LTEFAKQPGFTYKKPTSINIGCSPFSPPTGLLTKSENVVVKICYDRISRQIPAFAASRSRPIVRKRVTAVLSNARALGRRRKEQRRSVRGVLGWHESQGFLALVRDLGGFSGSNHVEDEYSAEFEGWQRWSGTWDTRRTHAMGEGQA
jgi:hypothetical protein